MRKGFIKAKRCVAVLSCAAVLMSAAGCSGSDDKDGKAERTTAAVTEATTLEEVTNVITGGPTEDITEATTKATTETTSETTTEENTMVVAFTVPNAFVEEYRSFTVASENLHDGFWDDVISNTSKGENKSPQLSWEPVEGASVYLIYMTDISASNWMHWKTNEVTETNLTLGWAPETDYVGPYPPPGAAHTYEIYVIALKAPVEEMKGTFDNRNQKFEDSFKANDIDADGNSGNIIAVGHISGLFIDN